MKKKKLIFYTRCTKTSIDYTRCEPAVRSTSNPSCGFACVKADRMYDRGVLRIEDNRPVLAVRPEDAKKISNESLSWEYACMIAGKNAIRIEVDFPGLHKYRKEKKRA